MLKLQNLKGSGKRNDEALKQMVECAVKSLLLRPSHFWMLRKVDKYLATEVLGSLIAPVFKGQVTQDELFLNCLTRDDGGR